MQKIPKKSICFWDQIALKKQKMPLWLKVPLFNGNFKYHLTVGAPRTPQKCNQHTRIDLGSKLELTRGSRRVMLSKMSVFVIILGIASSVADHCTHSKQPPICTERKHRAREVRLPFGRPWGAPGLIQGPEPAWVSVLSVITGIWLPHQTPN